MDNCLEVQQDTDDFESLNAKEVCYPSDWEWSLEKCNGGDDVVEMMKTLRTGEGLGVEAVEAIHLQVNVEIAQDNSISLKASANMLFDSTGDEDSERDGGVFFEEFKKVINEFLHPSLVLALIETIDHDEERSFNDGLPEGTFVKGIPKR
ncbi:hypothetical protein H1R20_g4782, partial [Candolleomyces eurysporus]